MDDQGLRNRLDKLGTEMTGKEPQGAPSSMTIEEFMYGEIFYCSHDGGYTRFKFNLADDPTTEWLGTLGWIWNGERTDPAYQARADLWESLEAVRLRGQVEEGMAWAARF